MKFILCSIHFHVFFANFKVLLEIENSNLNIYMYYIVFVIRIDSLIRQGSIFFNCFIIKE